MTENRCFEKVDFSSLTGEEEFYDCRFVSCDFSEVLFREPLFERCEFRGDCVHLRSKAGLITVT